MEKKTIVLLAPAELEADRNSLQAFIIEKHKEFIIAKNKEWPDRISVEVVELEDFFDPFPEAHLNAHYHQMVIDCDIFVMLFPAIIPDYYRDSFETLFSRFSRKTRPLLFFYFQNVETDGGVTSTYLENVKAFKKKLREYGYFYGVYGNHEELHTKFYSQLKEMLSDGFTRRERPKMMVGKSDDRTVLQDPTEKKSVQESAENSDEDVSCSVFAPNAALPGTSLMIQVFVHPAADATNARHLAEEIDHSARRRGFTVFDERVVRGSKLTVTLSLPGAIIDPPMQHLKWRGETTSVQFEVQLPRDVASGSIIGTVRIASNNIPFGHVKFVLEIIPHPGDATSQGYQQTTDTWLRYRYAFISYAADDRPEVVKRVQMLALNKIRFFQDLLTLEPGSRWEKELYKEIDQCDVFFLFWSTAAKNSEWVIKEVLYAIGKKKTDFDRPEIIPVIIEGPPPVAPPPELNHLHFNDPLIYFINA